MSHICVNISNLATKEERDYSKEKQIIEETFGGIWIGDAEEFAKFVSAVNKSPFEEDGEGIAYTDNYFYAYYRNINGEPVPYASVYMNEEVSQDIVNEILRDGREKKTAREWFDRFNAHARNVKSKNDAVVGSDKKARNTRTNGRLDSELSRYGAYYDSPELFVKSKRTYKGSRINYSLITPEMDATYLEAVERGDMATAQHMVMWVCHRYQSGLSRPLFFCWWGSRMVNHAKIKDGAPRWSTICCLRPRSNLLLDDYEWLISSYGVALSNEQAENLTSVVR